MTRPGMVCLPVDMEGPGSRVRVPGTTEGVCEKCGTKVLIAPSSAALIKEHDCYVVCMRCMPQDPVIIEPTEGQLRDMDALNPEVAERIRKMFQ